MTGAGTLRFEAGEWIITTTPDIAMRLKRIFPRMNATVATELRLRETPEIANDLEWVRVRFPFSMSAADEHRMIQIAAGHRKKLAELEAIAAEPEKLKAFPLAIPPREYQTLATTLYLKQGHLLCADEVGLGKTVTAIGSLTDPRTLPALIVVKAHLTKQWAAEVKRFIPGTVVHIVKTTAVYHLPPAHVYVITYSKLSFWWGIFARKVRSVIYDEIQELRVQKAKKYKAAELLNGELKFKLGLSATPVCNYGGEIWSVINLLAPDALGDEDEFHREWCVDGPGGKQVVKDAVALGHYLRRQNLMIRRTRKDVKRELPPVTRYVQEASFDEAIYNRGLSSADELAKIILSGEFTARGRAARQLDLELRQTTGLAKAPFVAELVRMLLDSGEKVLLGGWHRAVYDVWLDRLRDKKPAFFTGHENDVQKEKARLDFIEGRTDLLIMSLRSGAGTNGLQDVCSVAVLGELDWVPAVHDQFIGRLARDGQLEGVQVFIPVAPVGSDPTMASVLGLKHAQATGIVDLGRQCSPDFVETDPQRLRWLAINHLRSRGIKLPLESAQPVSVSSLHHIEPVNAV